MNEEVESVKVNTVLDLCEVLEMDEIETILLRDQLTKEIEAPCSETARVEHELPKGIIPWNGVDRPVPNGTIVHVIYSDKSEIQSVDAGLIDWFGPITGYEVIKYPEITSESEPHKDMEWSDLDCQKWNDLTDVPMEGMHTVAFASDQHEPTVWRWKGFSDTQYVYYPKIKEDTILTHHIQCVEGSVVHDHGCAGWTVRKYAEQFSFPVGFFFKDRTETIFTYFPEKEEEESEEESLEDLKDILARFEECNRIAGECMEFLIKEVEKARGL